MELRALKRAFMMNKAIKNYGRNSFLPVTPTEINILVAFYLAGLQMHGMTKTDVYKFLRATNNSIDFTTVCKAIDHLHQGQTIFSVNGGKIQRYCLSVVGKNLIMEIEERLRKERCDNYFREQKSSESIARSRWGATRSVCR